jgi:hypothetical protein
MKRSFAEFTLSEPNKTLPPRAAQGQDDKRRAQDDRKAALKGGATREIRTLSEGVYGCQWRRTGIEYKVGGGRGVYSCNCRKSKKRISHGWSFEGKLKMEILAETFLSASDRVRDEDSSLANHMGSPSGEGLLCHPNMGSQGPTSAE